MCGLVRKGVIKYLNYSFAVVILKCFKTKNRLFIFLFKAPYSTTLVVFACFLLIMERFWILIDFKDTDVVLFGSVLQ